MIDDHRLAPLGVVGCRLVRHLDNRRVQQQIIDARLAELGQRLLRKGLDVARICQVERQHCQCVRLFVKLDSLKGAVGRGDIARAEDDVVRLRLLQEELDGLEALQRVSLVLRCDGETIRTRPEETPVATMVFTAAAAIFN